MLARTPELTTPDDYRRFMRSEAGAGIRPGSAEEKALLKGFKDSRASQIAREEAARGTADAPGPIARELAALESGDGIIRATDAAQARRDGGVVISNLVSTETGQPAPTIEPSVAAIGADAPGRKIPIEHPNPGPQNVPVDISGASPVS